MINPDYESNWRPVTDFARHYDLDPQYQLTEVYQPANLADAINSVKEMALPEIVAYDGCAAQPEMIADKAAEMYPQLFGVEVELVEQAVAPLQPEAAPLSVRMTGSTGPVDWNHLAKHTRYAVSVERLPRPVLTSVE